MKITIAIDSFKGSLSSLRAGMATRDGIKKVYPDAEVIICPVADGGEGTVDALADGMGGKKKTVSVSGPLGEKVNALFHYLDAYFGMKICGKCSYNKVKLLVCKKVVNTCVNVTALCLTRFVLVGDYLLTDVTECNKLGFCASIFHYLGGCIKMHVSQ